MPAWHSARRSLATVCLMAVAAVLLSGCAATPRLQDAETAGLSRSVDLVDTPFFPDESHFCGPAALATSLSAAGLPTTPGDLVGKVFLPGREGSLQLEMLAGARRHGAVAFVIPASLAALLRELDAGNAVVVLLNLGLSWAPSWHYAVAVGYDLGTAQVLLRSGPMQRQELSFTTFENTWQRSERWAFVALPPGRLAATATEAEVARALVAYERNNPPAVSAMAYRSGLARWPQNSTLAMGLGNALYASGDLQGAVAVFRNVALSHDMAAAHNNQARVLLELGRRDEARKAAESGLAVAGPLRQVLLDTLHAIDPNAAANRP